MLKSTAILHSVTGGESNMANKAELVNNVAAATNLTKKDATAAVDAVFASIKTLLQRVKKFN